MTRGGRGRFCSYSRTTLFVCCVNLLAALYVLRSLYASVYVFSASYSATFPSASPGFVSFSGSKFSVDHINKMQEYITLRQAAQPKKLVGLVKKLEKKLSKRNRRLNLSKTVKQELASEILERLKGLEIGANSTLQHEALEKWRMEKLKSVKNTRKNSLLNSTMTPEEARSLKMALRSDWLTLLEDIGVWIPIEVANKEILDKPKGEEEPEIIAGQPLPAECHAEAHTDYDGIAVRWGLTHHKESAADCCQACLDQAKTAKPGEMKCNIWVYCPSEDGCHSPDIYQHKHQECWLKQTDQPRLNFKDKYSESYRSSHPSAPEVVPWMAGVIG